MRLRHIQKVGRDWRGCDISKTLQAAGYSKKEIAKLRKNNKVLVSSKNTRILKENQEMYVVIDDEEVKEERSYVDRGYLIDLD